MAREPTPHPRFRLYTRRESYLLPLRQALHLDSARPGATAALESEIARRFDAAAAVCVPSARMGLYLVLRALIRPGQAVVLSPLTIIDVVNMVILAGGVPVFADVRRDSGNLDPDAAAERIDGRTGAVLATHLHGETAGARAFQGLCRRRGVPLVEDAAQAFGAAEDGRRLGTFGEAGVFSFGLYKNVNCWQGGLVVSPDRGLIERIRREVMDWPCLPPWRLLAVVLGGFATDLATWPPLFARLTHPVVRQAVLGRVHAVERRLDPESGARRLPALPPAYRYGMTPAQVELALRQLDRVDADAAARIERADRYRAGLEDLDGLRLPPRHPGFGHVYSYFPIQTARREALLRFALERRHDFAAQHLRNCAALAEFAEFARDCPNARTMAREWILLPTYPRYPLAEVERTILVIRDFFQSGY